MVSLFNVGGNVTKVLFTLYIVRQIKGVLEVPEVALSLDELWLRDPVTEAEFIFKGDPLSLDPISIEVKDVDVYQIPNIRSPLKRKDRKIFVGASHDVNRMLDLRRTERRILEIRKPRHSIFLLKSKPEDTVVYYRRRFGEPEKFSKDYDFIFLSDRGSISIKCFSARFISEPKPFRKIPLRKIINNDIILALDPTKNIFTVMTVNGPYATIMDAVKLNAELPSLYVYLDELYQNRPRLIEEILALIRPKRR